MTRFLRWAERDLLNSIWRRSALTSIFELRRIFFRPAFALQALSTLEAVWGTWLLGGGLALSAALNGVTLIQLVQYWVCLERLLKRTLAHPLGPVFARLPDFVRNSIDRQISGSSNDLLRWVACARQYERLVAQLVRSDSRAAAALRRLVKNDDLSAKTQTALHGRCAGCTRDRRRRAGRASDRGGLRGRAAAEAAGAARNVTRSYVRPRAGRAPGCRSDRGGP